MLRNLELTNANMMHKNHNFDNVKVGKVMFEVNKV